MDAQHRLIFKGPLAYEQVQRVPLAIRVPAAWGGRGASVNSRDLVSNADLFPTLLDFAGVNAPACAGLSLRPVLTGRADRHARQDAFIDYPDPAVRTIRHQQWKYTSYPGVGPLLFNLDDDPDELHNRAGDPACRAVEEMLQARL
jgi:arylsulfatase A-like enzyme